MNLDYYQSLAVDAFEDRNHVAIIGAGGTGKSHVLARIVQRARSSYGFNRYVACAWSNNAARNIEGITLHKLFCAKVSWEWTGEGLLHGLQRKPRVLEFLRNLKVLIIDEIFTVKSTVFEAIDYVLRRLVKVSWHAGLPFGGRLLVVSGDPFQLEPIFMRHEKQAATVSDSSPWYHCFGNDASGTVVILPDNHRQASDPGFFSILSRIRLGLQTFRDLREVNATSYAEISPPRSHTRLVLTHAEADRINKEMLNYIESASVVSTAFDVVLANSEYERKETLDRLEHAALQSIVTKVGARVLLTRKSGDVYPGADLLVTNIRPYFLNGGKHRAYALVCVPCKQTNAISFGNEEHELTLVPMRTPIHSLSGVLMGYREQLPVVPAYAITVHRAQSLTLQQVAIDFSSEDNMRWNPYGQAYVALSRCTSRQGLWVRGLKTSHIRISTSAKALMDQIEVLRAVAPYRIISSATMSATVPQMHHLRSPRSHSTSVLTIRNTVNNASRSPTSPLTKRCRVDKENVEG